MILLNEQRQARADTYRHTYELHFNSAMTLDQILAFYRALSGLQKGRRLSPVYSTALDYYADQNGERWFLHLAPGISAHIDSLYYDHLDETIEPVKEEDDPIRQTRWEGVELGIRGNSLLHQLVYGSNPGLSQQLQPYKILDAQATSKSLASQMRHFGPGEAACVQWVIIPVHPRAAIGAPKEKASDHLFNAIARVGATGERAESIIMNLTSVFHQVESEHVTFRKRLVGDVGQRINLRAATKGFSLTVTAKELATLDGWPLSGSGAKRAKRIAPTVAHDVPGPGMIPLGSSNYPNMHGRQIAMPLAAADQHISLTGGTGTGKSVMLTNIFLGAIADPELSCIVLEPAGDLAWDMLRRIPAHRVKDVIFLNPEDEDYIIGINPFQGADPEQMASHILGIMKVESGDSWSATIQRVMGAAVLSTAYLQQTLYDTKQYLVNRDFRAQQLRRLPRSKFPQLRQEWDWVDGRPDPVVDSSVNRIEQFLSTRMMRNTLSQAQGLNFDWLIREHKILLVPLPAAKIGETNAIALGQIIRELAWNAAMRQPMDKRQRSMVIMDEYRHFADKSRTRSEIFSEARKYKQQLVIASQYLGQLPREIQETVERNVATHIAFRQSPEEAKNVVKRFGPLTDEDLINLPRYTAAARINSTDGIAPTVTLRTPPPAPMTPHWSHIIDQSRKLYAKTRTEVEAEILTRHVAPEPKRRPQIGRIQEPESE